jgi:hypothetical protein
MYSVEAIFIPSIVWGLFKYNELFITTQRNHQVHRDFLMILYKSVGRGSELSKLSKTADILETHCYPLTLCRSYLNPYCLGRMTAFFSVGI